MFKVSIYLKDMSNKFVFHFSSIWECVLVKSLFDCQQRRGYCLRWPEIPALAHEWVELLVYYVSQLCFRKERTVCWELGCRAGLCKISSGKFLTWGGVVLWGHLEQAQWLEHELIVMWDNGRLDFNIPLESRYMVNIISSLTFYIFVFQDVNDFNFQKLTWL